MLVSNKWKRRKRKDAHKHKYDVKFGKCDLRMRRHGKAAQRTTCQQRDESYLMMTAFVAMIMMDYECS